MVRTIRIQMDGQVHAPVVINFFFKTPPKREILSCQNDTLNKDFSVLFPQNLTSKWRFAQKFTPESDRIPEKVPYFLKIAAFDTLNVFLEFSFQSRKNLIAHFLGYLTALSRNTTFIFKVFKLLDLFWTFAWLVSVHHRLCLLSWLLSITSNMVVHCIRFNVRFTF